MFFKRILTLFFCSKRLRNSQENTMLSGYVNLNVNFEWRSAAGRCNNLTRQVRILVREIVKKSL